MTIRFPLPTLAGLAMAGLVGAAATAAVAQESPFASAGKGTATVAEMSSAPMPWWAPSMPAGDQVYHYRNIEMMVVSYATDFDKAAALVPAELDLLALPGLEGQAAVNLIFANYRENPQIGPYAEVVVAIPVLLDGMPLLYVPAIYVDTDGALIAGREFGGYPKKLAEIALDIYGNLYLGRIRRSSVGQKWNDPRFAELASAKVTRGGKLFTVPLPAEDIAQLPFPYNMLLPLPEATGKPQPYVLPTAGLRVIPAVGDRVPEVDLLQLIVTPWVITEAEFFAGLDPTLRLFPSADDPIAQRLPVNLVLGAYMLRGDMQTDVRQWKVVVDYLAK